jgi:peptidyl-prolyl cis-trans isomerase D
MNSPVISGVGNEPSVVGYAMGLSKNVISKAIVGNTGVFYIYVTDKRMSTGLQNYRNNISIINSARSGSARTGSFNALKDNAEIEDFRSLFY